MGLPVDLEARDTAAVPATESAAFLRVITSGEPSWSVPGALRVALRCSCVEALGSIPTFGSVYLRGARGILGIVLFWSSQWWVAKLIGWLVADLLWLP
jgi:hypothetical protein